MTRLAFIADVHGNLPALEAVVADIAEREVDQVVVAGDSLIWAPFSNQVLERIADADWPVIRGNQEYYLLDFGTPRAPAAWDDRAQYSLLHWQVPRVDPHWRQVIAAWPDTISLRYPDGPPIRVIHDSVTLDRRGVYAATTEDEAAALLAGIDEAIVVAAHTHLAIDRRFERWRVLNPGSVGVPLDGDTRAGYMLVEAVDGGWQPTWRRVAYDMMPLFAELERQGIEDGCGPIGRLVVEEFRTAKSQVFPFIRWRAAHRPDRPIDESLLSEYRLGFNRQEYATEPYR